MQKIVPQNSFEYPEAEHLVHIVDDPSLMKRKVAGVIRDSWGDIKPEKGRTLVHIIALSTFEKAGCNQNADAFEEEVCKKSHPGFMKTARLYRHHKKTEESKKDGDIVKTAMNEKMGRVELLLSAIDEKCADWLGDLDKGGQVNFSMGWKCLDPESIVKTINGYTPIKDIKIGDRVLDHRGVFSRVTNIHESPLGDRVVLAIKGHTWHNEILATNDHELLLLKKEQCRSIDGKRVSPSFDPNCASLEWVKAEDIRIGDYLTRPVLEPQGEDPIDNDTAYMLGQYLGDGNASLNTDHNVLITTHVNDDDIFNKMVAICLRKRWNFTVYHQSERPTHKKKMARTLRVRDPRFTILCKDLCGETTQKMLSPTVWDKWDEENFKHFLGGYIDADGSFDKDSCHIRMSTVLDNLADSIQQCLFSVGIVASAWRDYWKSAEQDGAPSNAFRNNREYAWVIYAPPSSVHILSGYSVKVPELEPKNRGTQSFFVFNDGYKYLACKVKDIKKSEKQSPIVNCLEVAGSGSFTVSGYVVHNCTNGDICSLCGNRAHKRDEYCEHLNKTASAPYGLGKILSDGRKCFTFNREGFWNDISYVGKGADMTAMDLNKVASAYGLNEVVVGGAELAEKYCPSSTILEKKAALLHSFRDSILPKFISGSIRMSVSTSLIDNKTAQEIADKGFNATRNAYREAGRIMPFDVFLCSLSKVAGAHNRVKVAMDGAYENFDEIAKDLLCHRKTASSIINSDTYCSLPTANNNVLSDSAKHDIRSQREMKIDEDFFIPQKVAYEKTAATELSPFFVQQYLDYKATESAEYGKNENELFDTFLLN